MMKLPDKPAAVSHVSDAHWEAALVKAVNNAGCQCDGYETMWTGFNVSEYIDHARCLILLGEVREPVDLIDAAMEAVWSDGFTHVGKTAFKGKCYKHFAGLTFPRRSGEGS